MWSDLKSYLQLIRVMARREEGQGMVEYALILALVSIAAIVTLKPLGTTIEGLFNKVTESI